MNAWTDSQIRELEGFHRVSLPPAYTGYLRGDFGDLGGLVAGDPNLVSDERSLRRLRTAAEEVLAEVGHPFTLAPNDFVFYFGPGPRFLYFRCAPGAEDPPVYSFRYGDTQPERAFDHFSHWVGSLTAVPAEATVTATGGSEAPSPHLELGELITPELQAELRGVEKRFRAELSQLESHLGWPLGAFRPATANLIAGLVFGVVLVALGGAVLGWLIYQVIEVRFDLPFAVQHGMSWLFAGIAGLLSAGLAAIGVYVIHWARRQLKSRLVLAPHGFAWVRPAHVEMLAWSDIREVEEARIRESLPLNTLLRYYLPKSTNRQQIVHAEDGRKFTFSANNVRQYDLLCAILERVAADLGIRRTLTRGQV